MFISNVKLFTFERKLDSVKVNQCAKYLGQRSRSFSSLQKSTHTHTQTHIGATAPAGPPNNSEAMTKITHTFYTVFTRCVQITSH